MKYTLLKYGLLVWMCCSWLAFAQEKKPESPHHAYKVDVMLIESENGKTINNRTYTMLINDGQIGSIRQGDRVPVNVSSMKDSIPQTQYMDVGLNLDCRLMQLNEGPLLRTTLDMSSLAPAQSQGASGNPIVRQQKYATESFVQAGKRAVIASVDQLDSKRRLQIEALLTQIQ
jgi:hypothetical protein